MTTAGLANLRVFHLCRIKDPVRNPTFLFLLILRAIFIAFFEAKGEPSSGFFLNLILASVEVLSWVVRGTDVKLFLRVDLLRKSPLVFSAVGVIKLDFKLLKLLHFGF